MNAEDRRRDAMVQAVLERHARENDVSRVNHTVQVTSFGGSGTTALCEHLLNEHVDLPRTPGQFPFKHQRTPPRRTEVPANFRVVYVLGDPRNAVLSVFRRRFQNGHYQSIRWAEPPEQVQRRLSSIETFLAAGVDDFMLADHLEQWLERSHVEYPVMFLRFDALPAIWSDVRDFVGLTPERPCLRVRPRNSDWESLPGAMRDRLDQMYGQLARRIAELPPVHVR